MCLSDSTTISPDTLEGRLLSTKLLTSKVNFALQEHLHFRVRCLSRLFSLKRSAIFSRVKRIPRSSESVAHDGCVDRQRRETSHQHWERHRPARITYPLHCRTFPLDRRRSLHLVWRLATSVGHDDCSYRQCRERPFSSRRRPSVGSSVATRRHPVPCHGQR